MQTALIHDFHYSTKEPDYWFELQTVTKMLLLKDPTPQKQNGELKNSIVYKKTTHFCPENRWSDSSTQGASRAIPRLSDSHILLHRCSPLQHNSIIPRSHETGWILAGIAFPGPGSWTLQLSKGRRITEKWIPADDQLSDVNRAQKLYITWIFPGLPHHSCPISKHRTREMSSWMSGVRVLGLADGPLGKLYMEVSTFGICC